MRKIEEAMRHAVAQRRSWRMGNTEVLVSGPLCEVYLHGNLIARCDSADAQAPGWTYSLAGWNTPTTKSRLRALGVPLSTKSRRVYVGEREVSDTEWFHA